MEGRWHSSTEYVRAHLRSGRRGEVVLVLVHRRRWRHGHRRVSDHVHDGPAGVEARLAVAVVFGGWVRRKGSVIVKSGGGYGDGVMLVELTCAAPRASVRRSPRVEGPPASGAAPAPSAWPGRSAVTCVRACVVEGTARGES